MSRRRAWIGVALVALLVSGFLVIRGLGDATLYFRTADEAIAQRSELGNKRFRIEGLVQPGSIHQEGTFTNFSITSKDVTVQVRNQGQPVGVFQENIPVVLEGRFAEGSDVFESDRIMVRHSSDYQEKHPDRVSGEANDAASRS